MDVPVIETQRLILRGHRLEDFDALAAMWADPHVARFIGGKPATQEESWARLLRYAGHWRLLGFGY
jgi:RimJ/RimL family protein N-acetyltransferase